MRDHKVYVHIFPNGKMYCGQTKQSINVRKHGYIKHTRIGSAVAHYGWKDTTTIVLQKNLSKEDADYFERRIIYDFQLQNPAFGYNMTIGGDGGQTSEMTDERRDHLSKMAKEFWLSHPETRVMVSKKMTEYLKDPTAYEQRLYALEKTRPLIRKKVQCLDADGHILGEWESARDAERFFNTKSIHFRGISSACTGRQGTHGGYYWRFANEPTT